jgi:hypothetical protein
MTGKSYSLRQAVEARASRRANERASRALSLAGSFRASERGRLRDRRVARLASANAHRDQVTRDKLVEFAEDLRRNNPIAGILTERKGEIVAGAKPGLRLMSASDDWNGRAAEYLERWGQTGFDHEGVLSFDQFAAFVVENAMQSGDGLVVLLENGSCQWIDGVRVRNPRNALDTDTMVGGVQLDDTGAVLGYHVAAWNPRGDMLGSEREFVDARDALYVGNPRGRRPGQRRCEPTLAALIDRIEDLDRLHEAVTKSAEMAAMLGVFVKSEHPEASVLDYGLRGTGLSGDGHGEDDGNIRIARDHGELMLRPGMIADLRPGESIETVNPGQPGNQYDRMVWTELQVIAARAGVPLELAFYYYTRNYAASRSAIVSAWMGVRKEQAWLKNSVLAPIVRWRLAMALRDGDLPFVEGWDRVQFKLPGIPTLDLNTEVTAVVNAVAGEVMTREDAVDRVNDGMGIDDFYTARGRELVRERELGIQTTKPTSRTETITTAVDETEMQP